MYKRNFFKPNSNDVIVSFGVLAYRLAYDLQNNCVFPEYLMVQRKDTLSFVEICRGRYNLFNADYIMHLFANMTFEEKMMLKLMEFDVIWESMWSHKKANSMDFNMAKAKFAMLKNGVKMKNANEDFLMDLDYIIANCGGSRPECEWNIPRGRRNNVESNLNCALREFSEETGIDANKLVLSKRLRPFVMDKLGSNGIMYRAIYYVAKCIDNNLDVSIINDVQAKEIRSVKWFDYKTVLSKLETSKQCATFEKLNKRMVSLVDIV